MVPNASPETLQQMEIGLTVADIERSRAFYRQFVGLEELPPVDDPRPRHQEVSIPPWQHVDRAAELRAALPADTSSGLIQYLVSNIERVETLAKERDLKIDRPLAAPVGAPLRTLWISDPDGITNYFTETPQSRGSAAP